MSLPCKAMLCHTLPSSCPTLPFGLFLTLSRVYRYPDQKICAGVFDRCPFICLHWMAVDTDAYSCLKWPTLTSPLCTSVPFLTLASCHLSKPFRFIPFACATWISTANAILSHSFCCALPCCFGAGATYDGRTNSGMLMVLFLVAWQVALHVKEHDEDEDVMQGFNRECRVAQRSNDLVAGCNFDFENCGLPAELFKFSVLCTRGCFGQQCNEHATAIPTWREHWDKQMCPKWHICLLSHGWKTAGTREPNINISHIYCTLIRWH